MLSSEVGAESDDGARSSDGAAAADARTPRRWRWTTRLTLRARLLISLVALVTLGLTAMGGLTYEVLAGYLRGRVDQQVVEAATSAVQDLAPVTGVAPDEGSGRPGLRRAIQRTPPGTYIQVRGPGGRVVSQYLVGYGPGRQASTTEGPSIPADLPIVTALGSLATPDVFTLEGPANSQFRAVATTAPSGITLVVALPLTDTEGTLQRLLAAEAAVAGVVVLLLAAVSWVIVRRDLAPLDRMTRTADDIAAGDLSRRVDTADDRTEVGRLGAALNTMLGQIEESFAARAQSEAQMRRFLADASHELRTPLTSIRGYAEMFHRGAADNPADLATAMRRIEGESSRMGGLVEDLLTLARLDEQRPMRRQPVDLVTLAEDAVSDARAVDPRRTVTLAAPEDAVVLGDDDRLRQAVANLVANALAYTPADSPIDLAVASDGATWRLAVRDHGPGLTPAQQARVFERFWRADPARTSGTAGSGLGLSIVASVLAAHGGRVDVDTPSDGGARFTLVLPVPDELA